MILLRDLSQGFILDGFVLPMPDAAPVIDAVGGTSLALNVGDNFSYPSWTASDSLGGVGVSWSGSVDTSKEGVYVLTATAQNFAGITTTSYSVTVVYENQITQPGTYDGALSVVVIPKVKISQVFHDGISIPEAAPKDPDSDVWREFDLRNLESGESVTYAVILIDGVNVEKGEAVNGLTYVDMQYDGATRIKARIKGGKLGHTYKLTLRYSTQRIPSDDKSMYIEIVEQ